MLKSKRIYSETGSKLELNQVFPLSHTQVLTVIQSQITLPKFLFFKHSVSIK